MFTNVTKRNGIFECKYEDGKHIFIEESISILFQMKVSDRKVKYNAITYRTPELLEQVELYLRNDDDYDMQIVSSLVVRFGWMDKNLNKLEFIPLVELVKKIRRGEATGSQINKLTAICKQLSLSMRKVLK